MGNDRGLDRIACGGVCNFDCVAAICLGEKTGIVVLKAGAVPKTGWGISHDLFFEITEYGNHDGGCNCLL